MAFFEFGGPGAIDFRISLLPGCAVAKARDDFIILYPAVSRAKSLER
jgi:hypothetical protein